MTTEVILVKRCEDCRHEKSMMEQLPDKTLERRMICLRFPPQVNVLMTPKGPMNLSNFPITQPDWMCGEFQPKSNNS